MRHRWAILAILAGAGLVRVGLLAAAWDHPQRLFTPDSEGYVRLASELVESGRFELAGEPEIFRTPGYPLLLTAAAPLGEDWPRGVALAQVVVDLVVVYLVYLLGCLMCRPAVGWLGAALYAASPLAIAGSLRVLSDGVFTLLVLLAVLMLVFHLRSGLTWALVAGAAALALGAYVRPVGLMYAIVAGVVLLGPRGRLRRVAIFTVVVVLVAAPWVIRNSVRAGYPGFSSFATDSLYYFGAPEITAQREGISPALARGLAWQRGHDLEAELGPGDAARARAQEARELVMQDPLLYARIHLAGTLGFWLPAANEVLEIAGRSTGQRGTLDVLHARGIRAAVKHYFGDDTAAMVLAGGMVAVLAAQYLGVLAWLVAALRWRMGAACWLGVAMVVSAALAVGPSGLPRYRLPVTPLLCLAAGAGWLALVGRFRRSKTG